MKKKYKTIITTAVIALGIIIWWNVPVKIMRHVNPDDINRIEVIGGETGAGFVISDSADIAVIVKNIQTAKLEKDSLSIGYGGGGFSLSFYNKNGRKIEEVSINSESTIKKSPFFYTSKESRLCIKLLEELEEGIVKGDAYDCYPAI